MRTSGEQLRRMRWAADESAEELAKALGKRPGDAEHIEHWEENGVPLSWAENVAAHFGVSVEHLMGEPQKVTLTPVQAEAIRDTIVLSDWNSTAEGLGDCFTAADLAAAWRWARPIQKLLDQFGPIDEEIKNDVVFEVTFDQLRRWTLSALEIEDDKIHERADDKPARLRAAAKTIAALSDLLEQLPEPEKAEVA